MFYVYILRSLKDKKLYVGYTSCLEKRLLSHKLGKVKATKNRLPLELVYYEECKTRLLAVRREKYLKSLYGAKTKKKLIENFNGKKVRI